MVCSTSYGFDGRVVKMVRSTAGTGFKVDLICPWNVKEGTKDGVYYRPYSPAKSRFTKVVNYPRIWRLLSGIDYDLYHFQHLDILPLFVLLKLFKRKPVVYDIRENYAEEMRAKTYIHPLIRPLISWGVKWGEWIGARIIKNLVVVVDIQERTYSGRGFNVVKVRNFAALELEKARRNNYNSRPAAVIFTGSQYIDNGSLLYLEIARRVNAVRPDVKLYNVDRFGIQEDTELKQKVLDKINKYKLTDVMVMLPNVKAEDIMSYINLATIAVCPNLNVPNQKMAIITRTFEYMAGGVPIVASNHPYHIEFIEKNNAGLLANPDCVDEFVEKILYLIDHREEARKMGENGRRAFKEKYFWEKEVEKLIRMYQEILGM